MKQRPSTACTYAPRVTSEVSDSVQRPIAYQTSLPEVRDQGHGREPFGALLYRSNRDESHLNTYIELRVQFSFDRTLDTFPSKSQHLQSTQNVLLRHHPLQLFSRNSPPN